MLLNLRIRDFAIIDAAEVEIPSGFTVVTGETGAGKSILVDALIVAMGGRASQEMVRSGATCAEVEALFDVSQQPLIQARLVERDLTGDDPHQLLVRRVISGKGRGKVVVNGHLSTVATLHALVRGLIDISGQHEQQTLLHTDCHLEILDAYAQLNPCKAAFTTAYGALRSQQQALLARRDALATDNQRADFLRFQADEIAQLAPQPGEDALLEAERNRLAHAEKLRHGAAEAEAWLYGEDASAFDQVGRAASELEELARLDPRLEGPCEILQAARRDIAEAARQLQKYSTRLEVDPTRLDQVEGRLSALLRLNRKHGGTLEQVLGRWQELSCELENITDGDTHIAELEGQVAASGQNVLSLARELSQKRHAAAERLNCAIVAEVRDMDLRGARFITHITPHASMQEGQKVQEQVVGPHGIDEVEFLWSANRGEEPRSLTRIASGGELSRLMLAVKGVLCHQDLVSVYVFDEVDTGLGGKAADSIGRKIQAVARGHQAITITHLAPIAARADHHLRVHKRARGARTVSVLEKVDGTARAEEIARMIDGASITHATRQAARAMLARRTGDASAKADAPQAVAKKAGRTRLAGKRMAPIKPPPQRPAKRSKVRTAGRDTPRPRGEA